MAKALALVSGGLDSSLAAALMLEQGVDVHGLCMVSLFNVTRAPGATLLAAVDAARRLGFPLTLVNRSREMLAMVKRPQFGVGKHMNPCIDCRLAVLNLARERMEELGCDFVVTGEVIGERPMSQRRQPLDLVQKRSGLGGLLLRPLSAPLLPPTIPEERGWVDRDRLPAIRGRSRKPQMELARRFTLGEYPSPAGGCLLTDPAFAARLADLLEHDPEADVNDAHLVKIGRHFRLGPGTKLIIGREHRENLILNSFARPEDALLFAEGYPGPTSLLRGAIAAANLRLAAAMTLRYGKGRDQPLGRVLCRRGREDAEILEVAPSSDEQIERCRLGCHP